MIPIFAQLSVWRHFLAARQRSGVQAKGWCHCAEKGGSKSSWLLMYLLWGKVWEKGKMYVQMGLLSSLQSNLPWSGSPGLTYACRRWDSMMGVSCGAESWMVLSGVVQFWVNMYFWPAKREGSFMRPRWAPLPYSWDPQKSNFRNFGHILKYGVSKLLPKGQMAGCLFV